MNNNVNKPLLSKLLALAGFATESSRLGASMPAIKRHGRWRSAKTVVEYIEAGRQFADSAVKVMFAG